MITVWKYETPIQDEIIEIDLPQNSEILEVAIQYEFVYMWVKHETNNMKQTRKFKWFGTGQEIESQNLRYIKTLHVNNGYLVFHLFEVL